MKASKFLVLVGGILGILAFFLPLVSVTRGSGAQEATGTLSAFQIVKGVDAVKVQVEQGGHKSDVMVSAEDVGKAKDGLDQIKGIVMAIFAPALLLALIGAAGVARKKFGRVAGSFSLLLGIVGLAIGMLLKSAAEGDSGIGLTLLLATGALGVIGGLMTLVKPERLSTVRATA